MFTDSVVDLVEAGAVTGNAKERNRGKIVTAFVLGTKRLYEFIHDNPMVEMRSVDFTNDSAVIRSFRRMVAINSAIEVDLTGQVVADSIGHRVYSGVGGQMDFIRGAALAPEGRAIIALPSTAAGGTVSRIAATLQPGAGVVTTRAHVRTVVTEYGVAELFGKSIDERAAALIATRTPISATHSRSSSEATFAAGCHRPVPDEESAPDRGSWLAGNQDVPLVSSSRRHTLPFGTVCQYVLLNTIFPRCQSWFGFGGLGGCS